MISNPHLPIVKRQAINWKHIGEIVLLVLLAFVLAIVIVGLLLAIGADQIEVG